MSFPIAGLRSFPWLAAFSILGIATAAQAEGMVMYRINCGGPAYLSSRWVSSDIDPHTPTNPGQKYFWAADTFFTGGGSYGQKVDIANSASDSLFQTERWNPDAPDGMAYDFPVPNGGYRVGFYFAEISPDEAAVGRRVFNVFMNGKEVFHNFDIFAVAGARTAYLENKSVKVTNGKIHITFENVAHHAKISALEITRDAIPRSLYAPYRINCGGDDYYDAKGVPWETDGHYSGGSIAASRVKVAGTADPVLFESERWNDSAEGGLTYKFDLLPGEYNVRLHFAETWDGGKAAGKRVFNVTLNGKPALENFDIFAAAGYAKEVIKEFPITIQGPDGYAEIGFRNVVHEAKIDAIEILPKTVAVLRASAGSGGAGTAKPVKAADALGRRVARRIGVAALVAPKHP